MGLPDRDSRECQASLLSVWHENTYLGEGRVELEDGIEVVKGSTSAAHAKEGSRSLVERDIAPVVLYPPQWRYQSNEPAECKPVGLTEGFREGPGGVKELAGRKRRLACCEVRGGELRRGDHQDRGREREERKKGKPHGGGG